MKPVYRLAFAATAVLFLGCGGSADSRPKPLRSKIDDMYLSSIPTSEKNDVLETQNQFSKAKMDYANADHELQEAKTKIKIAKNELKQAQLERESAKATKQDADRSADMNRVKSADRELRIATTKVDASKAKIDAWKTRSSALKKKKLWAEEAMYAAEAKFELSKARLAQQRSISPKGFKFGDFEEQANTRSRRAQQAKAKADKAMAKAKQKWDRYKSAEADVVKASGSTAGSSN